jgi:hypothetical protein
MDMRAFFSVKNMSNNTHYKGGDMGRLETLKERQLKLKEDIASMLDSFLIGTVAKSPSMTGHNLTTKVEGKTVTLYVRKNVAPVVLEMSKRYKMLWALIQALSKVNWELINLDNK